VKQFLDIPKIPIVRPDGNQSLQPSGQQNPIERHACNQSLHPPSQQFPFVRAPSPSRPSGLIPRGYRPPDAHMLQPGNYVWKKRPVVTREALLASFPNNSNRFSNLVMSQESSSSAQGGGTDSNTIE
ncbi:maestro heat-like repeat-containing protein family member 2A, partial [Sesbania bispinosa]